MQIQPGDRAWPPPSSIYARWFESHLSNGTMEGFNSLLQSAKSGARSYRAHKNFINIAYLVMGKIDLKLPT